MELSIFLAKVIGIFLMLVAASLLINKKNTSLLFDLYKHATAVYITGILETFIGVVFVVSHNIWAFNFQGVLTLIGWIILARGLGRILFPVKATNTLEKLKKMQIMFVPLLVFIFLIGAYLAYIGFTS